LVLSIPKYSEKSGKIIYHGFVSKISYTHYTMHRSTLFLTAVFWGTNLALVQTMAVAKTKVEIGRIAKSITVRLESIGSENKGSGTILQKQGDVYTILTAAHVVAQGKTFKIFTPDGQVYDSISVRKANSNLDLAVVKFRSSKNYQVATIGTSNGLESGSEVYVAGFPAATRTIDDGVFNFTKGDITGNASKPNSKGYSLIYNCITLPGMSGGPILNDAGQLVAIHGQGDRDTNEQKTGFNLGITIERFGTVAKALDTTAEPGIAAVPVSTQLKPADFLLTGWDKSQAGNYQGALNDYNRAIELNPRYANAYNYRGFLKENQFKDVAGALADYNRAIELNPQYDVAHNNRGYLKLNKQNDVAGALADYNQAIVINPKYHIAYNNRGYLKLNFSNDLPAALADYNQSIAINPRYAVAYNNRGVLKKDRLKDYSGALADYNRAIELNPQYPNAYNNRGVLKVDALKDPDGALADYSRAIILDPKYAVAYHNRGLLKASNLKDPNGALQDYNRAIALDPKYVLAYNNRGFLKVTKLQDTPGALADYNRAIELNPKYAIAYNNRGVLKVDKLQDATGGLADYSRAIELNQKYALAYYNRGIVKKNRLNDRPGAIRDFQQAANLFRQQGKTADLQDALNELRALGAPPD
jgi:tetratricopeptide (TPR) repeat protein